MKNLKKKMTDLIKLGRLADPNLVLDMLKPIEEEIEKLNAKVDLLSSVEKEELITIIAANFRYNMPEPIFPSGARYACDGIMQLYDDQVRWYEKAKEIEEKKRGT